MTIRRRWPMRRAVTTAIAALIVLAIAFPALAAIPTSGTKLNILSGGPTYAPDYPSLEYTLTIDHPAGEPFHIKHGWYPGLEGYCWTVGTSNRYTAELFMDGAPAQAVLREIKTEGRCWKETSYILNFPAGLTGEHVFQIVFHFPFDTMPYFPGADTAVFNPVRIRFTETP